MTIQNRLFKTIASPFVLWMVAISVGLYFMLSVDRKALQQPVQPGFVSAIKHYVSSLGFNYVKKGIDLAGGTYLVLGVELEKALVSRLQTEVAALEATLTKQSLGLPTKKEVVGSSVVMTFATPDATQAAGTAARQERGLGLVVKLEDEKLVAVLTQEEVVRIRTEAVEQAVRVLTSRLGGYGVEGIVVQQHGERQVVVQLPGVSDVLSVKDVITKTANLEFKLVERSAYSKDALLEEFDGDLPSDKVVIPGRGRKGDDDGGQWYLVSAFPDVTGNHITNAMVDRDEFNRSVVNFKLDAQGARDFHDLTAANVGRQLAIVIDDVVYTAPNINSAIPGGSGVITGSFTPEEAFALSVVLKSGSLQAPLKIEQENRVGASLGQDSIQKGFISCLIALLLIFFFSVMYYKIPGFFAVCALLCNIFLTLAFLSYFRATLTLPGIAGIVLTIGMAIDASILIYERIKEELAIGVPLRKAIADGFSGVMAVILDSNITTFLTGLVLYQFGGPAIKGFAVTLMAGIIATLLSGIYFLRSMFTFYLDVTSAKTLKF